MAEQLLFDPTSEGTGTELDVMADPYGVTTMAFPAPPPDFAWAGSMDTEGDGLAATRHQNRRVALTVEVVGSTAVALDAAVATLQAKIAKVWAEGGTLRRVRADATYRTLDLLSAESYEPVFDIKYMLGNLAEVTIGLVAKPYWRGAQATYSTHAETTLPHVTFTETAVPGDIPALGVLEITEAQAQDQQWVTWGIQSRYYSADVSAALFYEAEGRTSLSGAATAVGPSGASGGGSNVVQHTSLAAADYTAVLSTQATGGGAHLSHIGSFRVYARFQAPATNTGTVTVMLEWGEGDFRRFVRNPPVTLDAAWEGSWRLADLGLVTLTQVVAGTQRWEGRILAKSTVAGDDLNIDHLFLVPVDEGSGIVKALPVVSTSTTYTARDEFDHAAGALVGKVAPIPGGAPGTWSNLSGPATGFSTTGSTVTRATTSDASIRIDLLGTLTTTNVIAQLDCTIGASGIVDGTAGIVLRVVDASNYLMAVINDPASSGNLIIKKVVAGVTTVLGTSAISTVLSSSQLRVMADAGGRMFAWWGADPPLSVQDAALATGGTLASGKFGIADAGTGATTAIRTYDNFAVWVPTLDAAVFASQSLQVRHDRVVREDSGGTLWVTPSSYVGDYLRVPVAGADARTIRMIVKASRNDPATGADSAIDDLSATLTYIPRYLSAP